MNKIRVIKKNDRAEVGRSFDMERGSRPSKQELIEVVGDWVADWRKRSELETRRALNDCVRFRLGSSIEV